MLCCCISIPSHYSIKTWGSTLLVMHPRSEPPNSSRLQSWENSLNWGEMRSSICVCVCLQATYKLSTRKYLLTSPFSIKASHIPPFYLDQFQGNKRNPEITYAWFVISALLYARIHIRESRYDKLFIKEKKKIDSSKIIWPLREKHLSEPQAQRNEST